MNQHTLRYRILFQVCAFMTVDLDVKLLPETGIDDTFTDVLGKFDC